MLKFVKNTDTKGGLPPCTYTIHYNYLWGVRTADILFVAVVPAVFNYQFVSLVYFDE